MEIPETEMLVTSPKPDTGDLPKYYESDSYISHTDNKKGMIPFLYGLVKKRSLKKKLRLINRYSESQGTLLDIGAGTGAFLALAMKQGWKTFGVEPNDKARNSAVEKGLELGKSITDVQSRKYDVITLWHVLEHIPDLEKTTQQLEHMLLPNGLLVVAVPNYKSFDANYYKEFWAAYDVPRHLWHFSRKSMETLFRPILRLLKIKPMIFDSFYVSLLSEKYKTGNSFSIRAFFIGLWSNIAAWRTKEYSSLIYCFKKSE